MSKPKHSKENIIETLKNLSKKLGRPNLSKKDIETAIPASAVRYHFGSLGTAANEAGLVIGGELPRRPKLTDDELFSSLYDVEQKLGHEPTSTDCSAFSKYSPGPYTKRFGGWDDVRAQYRKWKAGHKDGVGERPDDISGRLAENDGAKKKKRVSPFINDSKKRKSPDHFYGEPIDFRGLRHAPTNEQGVVFLFGMVSRELGFNIEAMQQGFPDCEGKYLHNPKKNLWAKARIEFEYLASNFREHNHDPDQCDFIVCWLDDWPECPVNVIELKTEILKLNSR